MFQTLPALQNISKTYLSAVIYHTTSDLLTVIQTHSNVLKPTGYVMHQQV